MTRNIQTLRLFMRERCAIGCITLAVLLYFFLEPYLAQSQAAPDTSHWVINVQTIFLRNEPANPNIKKLLESLDADKGEGEKVNTEEFKEYCRLSTPVVYVKQLIKYATPKSVQIQKQEHADYSKVFMKESRQKAGIQFLHDHKYLLDRAENEYDVARKDVVSILMWESGLGEFVGDYYIFNIFMGQLLYVDLAREFAVSKIREEGNPEGIDLTLNEKEKKRLDRIRYRAIENLTSLLRNAKKQFVDPLTQKGSWGGAIGFVQFMPSSLIYAVDGDRDGIKNLNSWPDAILSVANFLKEHGYGLDASARNKGIYGYNPIDSYVKGVVKYADAIWFRYQNGE